MSIEALQAALKAGPTLGPWKVASRWVLGKDEQAIAVFDFAGATQATLEYIAACDPETIQALLKLARFGAWAASEFRRELGDLDGASAQDAMERFGVLEPREVDGPCGESCACADWGDFPQTCYAYPSDIATAINDLQQDFEEGQPR